MEHPFFINANPNRAEANRWFSIAEKLLNTRDLLGSRSFATRARDCDPTLLQAEQVIAIADTLLAREKRINNQHFDWYGILQVPPDQRNDEDFIANQYHRLAVLLSPDKNNFPLADQALRLVLDAWSLLSNRFRKKLYDEEIGFFLTRNQEPPAAPPQNEMSSEQLPSAFNIFPDSGGEQKQQQMHIASHEQQPISTGQSFLSSMQQQQSSSSKGQQQGMFLNRDQQQQVTPICSLNSESQPPETYVRSSTREPDMISFGSSPDSPEQLPVASVQSPSTDPQSNMQPQQQNEGVVGNTNDDIVGSSIDNDAGKDKEKEIEVEETKIDIPSFWTACPYCYHMFEYPDVYVDCTLRCQNCRLAYQAIATPSPPPIIDGKDAYFCCWGFIPLGFSMAEWERSRNRATSWSPFSPMFTCPLGGGRNEDISRNTENHAASEQKGGNSSGGGFQNAGPPKGGSAQRDVTPRMDDGGGHHGGGHHGGGGRCNENDEPLDSSGVSEDESHDGTMRKKLKSEDEKGVVKTMTPPSKSIQKQQPENGKNGIDGLQVQSGTHVTTEATKKSFVGNARRQSGRIARDYGKLDLNVEFSNDGEEHPHGMGGLGRGRGCGAGGGMNDNIEGIGFFEGLDEFLSSLPILNVVGEDKVKAA